MVDHLEGSIVTTIINNKKIQFFVANKSDMIQTYHYHGKFYEEEELDIIRRFFYPGGILVDIGANVGNHAIYVSKFLDPRSVIVFEPNPSAISILRLNLNINGCLNVDTRFLGVALGATSARLRLEEHDPNNLGSARLVPDEWGHVPAIAGDVVLEKEAPSFIKIDIEGMELEVLHGLRGTVQQWRPNIFIEIQAVNLSAFYAWCEAMHYKVVEQYQRYDDILNFMIVSA